MMKESRNKKIGISLLCVLVIGCLFWGLEKKVELKGTYSSEVIDGKVVLLTINPENNTFIQYINQRKVDSGKYSENDNIYSLSSDIQNFDIKIDRNNSFEIIIDKLNGKSPIIMKNSTKVCQTFSSTFGDEKEYIELIGK